MLNNNFQSVFTEERPFEAVNEPKRTHNIEYINFEKKELVEELKDLTKQKASGPDEISNWILSECAEQLCEPMQIIFQRSIKQGNYQIYGKKQT